MKTTGEMLRESREKQGLTINEVALLIKVNTKTVVAIEEGDLDSLPAKTFLRGFVRSYAKLLKLDVNGVLQAFYEEMGSTKPKLAIRDQNNEEQRKKALEQSMEGEDSPLSKKLLWGAAGVFALVMIVFVLGQVEKYENESKTTPPPPELKAITPIENDERKDDVAKAEVKEPEQKPKAKEAPQEEPKEVAKKQQPEPEDKVEEPSEEKIEVAKKQEDTVPPKKASPQEVIVEAFDRITVSYQFNGGKNATLKLKEDDVRIIKGNGAIKLKISDGGSVNLVHNGKDLGVPGSLGSPLDLTLQ